jgi:CcmD family protein
MTDNQPWLFAAFALGWLIIFLYLAWIAKRERELRRRVDALQLLVDHS